MTLGPFPSLAASLTLALAALSPVAAKAGAGNHDAPAPNPVGADLIPVPSREAPDAVRRADASPLQSIACETDQPGQACPDGDFARLATVYFVPDRFDLTPEAALRLDELIEKLGERPWQRILLEGHVERPYTSEYAISPSQRLTASVQSYLVAGGIPASSISSIAYGNSRPAATTSTETREPLDRRVEISVDWTH